MVADIKTGTPLPAILREVTDTVDGFSAASKQQFFAILDKVPMAYQKVNAIFSSPERKAPGSGGIFSIFVSDLCKGCAACVTACGDHMALSMVAETEEVNAEHETGTGFLDLLPDTSQKYLGLFNAANPADSKTATLRNMLMVRSNYDALVSGDGACAGCGEKSVLRSIAAVTEAYMRPVYHAKSDRFLAKAGELEKNGVARLAVLKARSQAEYALLRQAIAHLVLGLGGEDETDTRARIAAYEAKHGPISDAQLVEAIAAVLLTEAFNHKNLQAVDGRLANGMSVMAMAAHTGCNTVYGSTAPNNPHPYPWMNSLFQDGVTVGWLMGESFIVDHARRSVIPERLADILLTRDENVIDARGVLPPQPLHRRADDRPGDRRAAQGLGRRRRRRHGRHRLSEHVQGDPAEPAQRQGPHARHAGLLQHRRPELRLHAHARRQRHERLRRGHPGQEHREEDRRRNLPRRPRFALRRAGLHGQRAQALPRHSRRPGVSRHHVHPGLHHLPAGARRRRRHGALPGPARARLAAACPSSSSIPASAKPIRRLSTSRAIPPSISIGTRPRTRSPARPRRYTVAHWCTTEARFRNHLKKIKPEAAAKLIPLDNMLVRITQQDVVYRRYLDPGHRAFIPDFGVYITVEDAGKTTYYALSRQLVMFCVERRKAWRMLQSKAGIVNKEYAAQRALLAEVDAGKLPLEEFLTRGHELLKERLAAAHQPKPESVAPAPYCSAALPVAPASRPAVAWTSRSTLASQDQKISVTHPPQDRLGNIRGERVRQLRHLPKKRNQPDQ